jgi:hypothetical protein
MTSCQAAAARAAFMARNGGLPVTRRSRSTPNEYTSGSTCHGGRRRGWTRRRVLRPASFDDPACGSSRMLAGRTSPCATRVESRNDSAAHVRYATPQRACHDI